MRGGYHHGYFLLWFNYKQDGGMKVKRGKLMVDSGSTSTIVY